MKVLAYYICHYGKEYFDCSLQSVSPFVDKIIVLYTAKPSQGHDTDLPCPDTREEMREIAAKYPKVEWHDVTVGNEGQHTSLVFQFSQGYDIILRADCDEVFDPIDLPKALEQVYNGNKRWYGVNGFHHFWKTFDWVCKDHFQPVRFCRLADMGTEQGTVDCRIYHFSCCQRIETIKYKLKVSGHFDEIFPEWLSLYENWKPTDKHLHLTSKDIWGEAVPFDKNTLPDFLKSHERFSK